MSVCLGFMYICKTPDNDSTELLSNCGTCAYIYTYMYTPVVET